MATKATGKNTGEPIPVKRSLDKAPKQPADTQSEDAQAALGLDELIEAAVEQDGMLAEQQEALKKATEAKITAQEAALAAWDMIYDRLMELREKHKTSPAFDQSKLKRLLNRADR